MEISGSLASYTSTVVYPQDQEVWEAKGISYRSELGDKAGAPQWCVHHTVHAPSSNYICWREYCCDGIYVV